MSSFCIATILTVTLLISGCTTYSNIKNDNLILEKSIGSAVSFQLYRKFSTEQDRTVSKFTLSPISQNSADLIMNEIKQSHFFKDINLEFIDYRSNANGVDIDCYLEVIQDKDQELSFYFPVSSLTRYEMNWKIRTKKGDEFIYSAKTTKTQYPFFLFFPIWTQDYWNDRAQKIIYGYLVQNILEQIDKDIKTGKIIYFSEAN